MVRREWFFALIVSLLVLTSVGVMPSANTALMDDAANGVEGLDDGLLSSHDGVGDSRTMVQIKAQSAEELAFLVWGHTEFGNWQAEVNVSPAAWRPGVVLRIDATLQLTEGHLSALEAVGKKVDQLAMLVTAERTFDADGWLRLPSDERMSTMVTPTGLAIEGGVQGAVSKRFGYGFRTPVDEFQTRSPATLETTASGQIARFGVTPVLPEDLPPGLYRLRVDFGGVLVGGRRTVSLNGDAFAQRPPALEKPVDSHLYSPPLYASGFHASGRPVDAAAIQPHIPWVLLYSYNSNGYRGIVADEDRGRFALSDRNIIPDDVILPLYNERGYKVSYSLEPQFPTDSIDARMNIPWDYTRGELTVQVTGPDGKTKDLGTAPFVDKRGWGATTKRPAFTAWRPQIYGQYTVRATGWIADRWGNRYAGGGTYRFWIAKRMTMATATFQGQSYPVGGRYGRDIGFAPAVPADVQVTAKLYVNSDPNNVKSLAYTGKASPGGLFGAAQGAKPFPLDAPGEYYGHVLATYTDAEGHLWVNSVRHAGVVYPLDTPLIAHGKKLTIAGSMVDRGETHFEGYVDPGDDSRRLAHVNFPYQTGDVLLIASEQQGANKIEPVLTYEIQGENTPYERRFQGIGVSNIQAKTSNGYSPHLFPEYITDLEYFYASAPRPGFMSRFLVAESGVRGPYWPTSPNSFGGQIGSTSNGDSPGDIYRLLGGVVLKRPESTPLFGGYVASAFILPRGSNNNRVVAPGSEDVIGSDGTRARFFLVGIRPGAAYETGTLFAPPVQIDPMVPAKVRFVLRYPDGREKVAEGTADKFGSFVGSERWTLDISGVYRYWLEAEWESFKGHMPGLPAEGGQIYVFERERPAGATGMKLDLPSQSRFAADEGLVISGTSSAQEVSYAAVIPGSVIAVGAVPVVDGRFEYFFDPAAINARNPTYDIVNVRNGKPEIGRVVHFTLFSRETGPDGQIFHDFIRVIMRGTQVIVTR